MRYALRYATDPAPEPRRHLLPTPEVHQHCLRPAMGRNYVLLILIYHCWAARHVRRLALSLTPETAMVPPRVLLNKSVAGIVIFTFLNYGSVMAIVYYFAIWIQVARA
ncbi:uncharacterized protein M421DRAFT_400897 [Didymella exigua CBS 183.55]|uniref:Uncharacterized protein n=1 Tax=Didymella exigua CBS 183.55 TaxID=1150837 RepID=A0A6A5RBU0_9PLEO|nr:uncharacterized protein M421DRAFT_400897 [Didymella exigua CBS 183.55]KAF1924983.1 hypothetical protein M421DRAFT_400897 [Didymella exigua CBS 183.55]